MFSYYPPLNGLYRSFFDWDPMGNATFIGFANYQELFQDKVFLDSIPTMFSIMLPKLVIGVLVPVDCGRNDLFFEELESEVYLSCIGAPANGCSRRCKHHAVEIYL